jgi:hypothetical protein
VASQQGRGNVADFLEKNEVSNENPESQHPKSLELFALIEYINTHEEREPTTVSWPEQDQAETRRKLESEQVQLRAQNKR